MKKLFIVCFIKWFTCSILIYSLLGINGSSTLKKAYEGIFLEPQTLVLCTSGSSLLIFVRFLNEK